jgi:hypothetical protein
LILSANSKRFRQRKPRICWRMRMRMAFSHTLRRKVSQSQPSKNPASEKPLAEMQREQPDRSREVVSREEFEALESKVERLSTLVWSLMLENGEIDETAPELFDEQKDYEFETSMST